MKNKKNKPLTFKEMLEARIEDYIQHYKPKSKEELQRDLGMCEEIKRKFDGRSNCMRKIRSNYMRKMMIPIDCQRRELNQKAKKAPIGRTEELIESYVEQYFTKKE